MTINAKKTFAFVFRDYLNRMFSSRLTSTSMPGGCALILESSNIFLEQTYDCCIMAFYSERDI